VRRALDAVSEGIVDLFGFNSGQGFRSVSGAGLLALNVLSGSLKGFASM